jgi:hypothetical protein
MLPADEAITQKPAKSGLKEYRFSAVTGEGRSFEIRMLADRRTAPTDALYDLRMSFNNPWSIQPEPISSTLETSFLIATAYTIIGVLIMLMHLSLKQAPASVQFALSPLTINDIAGESPTFVFMMVYFAGWVGLGLYSAWKVVHRRFRRM